MIAWITLVIVCGIVWGGFGLLLYTAIKKESMKK